MPLDGIFLSQLQQEISAVIVGGRVDKIHQPAKETIVVAMRAQGGNHKLLISEIGRASCRERVLRLV